MKHICPDQIKGKQVQLMSWNKRRIKNKIISTEAACIPTAPPPLRNAGRSYRPWNFKSIGAYIQAYKQAIPKISHQIVECHRSVSQYGNIFQIDLY